MVSETHVHPCLDVSDRLTPDYSVFGRCKLLSSCGIFLVNVPVNIDGKVVFSIGEALREAAVSRATFFRWVKEGLIQDTEFRDRNNRRVFTAGEVEELKRFAHRLIAAPQLRIPMGNS